MPFSTLSLFGAEAASSHGKAYEDMSALPQVACGSNSFTCSEGSGIVPASDSDNSDTLPAAAYQALTAQQGLPGSQPLLACHGLLVSTAMISDALPMMSQPLLLPLGPPSPTVDPINAPMQQLRTSSDQNDSQFGDGKVRKGQGYRRLWQMVTKVQRGQRLADGTFEWRDCTVEDLLKIVQQLPANTSTVAAVAPGLVYLDSRAAAAFFKALAKTGHGARAVELFDYLRCAPCWPWQARCTLCIQCPLSLQPMRSSILQQCSSGRCLRSHTGGTGATSAKGHWWQMQQQQQEAPVSEHAAIANMPPWPCCTMLTQCLPVPLRMPHPRRLTPCLPPLPHPFPLHPTPPQPGRWRRATSCAACVMCSPTPP
jgi:hypothetical protein